MVLMQISLCEMVHELSLERAPYLPTNLKVFEKNHSKQEHFYLRLFKRSKLFSLCLLIRGVNKATIFAKAGNIQRDLDQIFLTSTSCVVLERGVSHDLLEGHSPYLPSAYSKSLINRSVNIVFFMPHNPNAAKRSTYITRVFTRCT